MSLGKCDECGAPQMLEHYDGQECENCHIGPYGPPPTATAASEEVSENAPVWLTVLNGVLGILEGPKAGWDRLEGFNIDGIKEDLNRRLDPRFVEDQPTNPSEPPSNLDQESEVQEGLGLTGTLRHEAYGDFINAGKFDLQAQDERLREIPAGPVEVIVRPLTADECPSCRDDVLDADDNYDRRVWLFGTAQDAEQFGAEVWMPIPSEFPQVKEGE